MLKQLSDDDIIAQILLEVETMPLEELKASLRKHKNGQVGRMMEDFEYVTD